MGRYEEILKRNEQLIDNAYEINEEIADLAYENEELFRENEELFADNEILNEQNVDIRREVEELHKKIVKRRTGNGHRHNNVHQQRQTYEQKIVQQDADSSHRTISIFVSEKTKKNMMFSSLVFLILLLGLGIEPGVALTYDSILDCFLELIFNLYKLCILGGMGLILRKIWKKF